MHGHLNLTSQNRPVFEITNTHQLKNPEVNLEQSIYSVYDTATKELLKTSFTKTLDYAHSILYSCFGSKRITLRFLDYRDCS